MSVQRLSAKTRRRIERHTGLTVVRAWAAGGYDYEFVTPDHKHVIVNQKSWEFKVSANPQHFNTCSEMFPDFDMWADFYQRRGRCDFQQSGAQCKLGAGHIFEHSL